jgi:hypothetical protein
MAALEDKELAQEWVKNNTDESPNSFRGEELQEAFLAGLEAGRPKWHDLRKNPDDLPTDKHFKITSDGDIALYDWFLGKWYDLRSDELTYQPIAWCEIPKYTEE